EHRLDIGGRTADDPEHLARCRLMLKGLAQFRVALLELLEQPDVLNGDDRLISKALEKSDLFFREWSDFRAANQNTSNGNTLTEQRRCQRRTNAETSSKARSQFIFRHCRKVMNVNSLPINDGSGRYRDSVEWGVRSGGQRSVISHSL